MPSDPVPPSGCPDWTALARDYAANALGVSEVCALHGVSSRTLYRRAHLEGWPLRHPERSRAARGDETSGSSSIEALHSSDKPEGGEGVPSATPPAQAVPERRKRSVSPPRSKQPIAKRLLTVLEKKMSDLESRLADASTASATDSARDARTLNTLVTLFEKMEKRGAMAASSGKPSPDGSPAMGEGLNANRMRDELAQRLEALRSGLAGGACAAWDHAIANPTPPGAWTSRALGLRGERTRLG